MQNNEMTLDCLESIVELLWAYDFIEIENNSLMFWSFLWLRLLFDIYFNVFSKSGSIND